MARRFFQNVFERRDERMMRAADVLQIHQQDIERIHHRRRWPPHFGRI
jgi:hypothetical protein